MKRTWIITICQDKLDNLDAVVNELRSEGLEIVKVYPYGVIVGKAISSIMSAIGGNDNIQSYSQDKEVTTQDKEE